MKLPFSMERFVNLTAGSISYTGPSSLSQYTIKRTEMTSVSSKYVVIKITLGRIFMHHIATTFAPTILLMILTLLTLFIDYDAHFDGVVGVHLTTMLVMYTLYGNTLDSMPSTAYLKSIDIFLLYGVVLPFFTFLSVIIATIINHKERESMEEFQEGKSPLSHGETHQSVKVREMARKMKLTTPEDDNPESCRNNISLGKHTLFHQKRTGAFVMKIFRIILPIITVLFVVTYFIFSLSSF